MKRKVKFHIHSHTNASDGRNTLMEMAEGARSAGIDLFFLTDHNTLTDDEVIKEAEEKTGVMIVQGIEYTTFYGHIISFGSEVYPIERIRKDGLNDLSSFLKNGGGVTGIAHPMGIGDPVCTGCAFGFTDVNYEGIDYMEVYHGNENEYGEWEKNLIFYNERLSEGHRLFHVFAGDYHSSEGFSDAPLINVTEVSGNAYEEIKEEVKSNVKNGKVLVTSGITPEISLIYRGESYFPGDTIIREENNGDMILMINNMPIFNGAIVVSSEKGEILRNLLCEGTKDSNSEALKYSFSVGNDILSIKTEIKDEDKLLVFSNPIFIVNRK